METGTIAREFVTFCINECRDGLSWEALYDQMCWVAGRRLYRGMGYRELAESGVSLGLLELDNVYALASEIVPLPS